MRLPFRQGIVRYQTDGNYPNPQPTFLRLSANGLGIDIVVSPDPTIITFAHGNDVNYLYEESRTVLNAWQGPFNSSTDYWLYWDIDVMTAARTFGYTTVEPVVSYNMPVDAPIDTHWFDLTTNTMRVLFNGLYAEKIRVFAGKLRSGGVIESYALGTQVGLDTQCVSGSILFDEQGNPIRQSRNHRIGRFVTTESNFLTHASSGSTVRIEAMVEVAQAENNIGAYQLVCARGYDRIGYASSADLDHDIVGISREVLMTGEVGTFIPAGFVTNPFWHWTQPAGTRLFCDTAGQVTPSVPQTGSFQQIGTVWSSNTIILDIHPRILLEDDQ